jgi:hypothetical protein
MIFTSLNTILGVVLAGVWQRKSQQFRHYTCQVKILLFPFLVFHDLKKRKTLEKKVHE